MHFQNQAPLIEAEQFYTLSHIFISFIGAILLLAIWYNIQINFKSRLEQDNQKRIDKGLAFVSAAIFVWVLSGLYSYFTLGTSVTENQNLAHAIGTFFSTLNNIFLLLALYYFDESPSFIYKNDKNQRFLIIGVITLSILSVIGFQFWENSLVYGMQTSNLPDLVLSGFLSYLLITTFYNTFSNRGLHIVSWLSLATVLLMFYSQLPEVFVNMSLPFESNMLKLIAKSSLISVFLVLATSWVIQLANTPKQDEMKLQFLDWSLIVISIPSKGIKNQTIDFESKTTQFKNLLKFALRRKFATPQNQYISIGHGKEIDRQTYLTRIVENMNTIANLTDEEKLFRKDLFTFVGQGQYRLRLIPENIVIDETLKSEFLQNDENSDYLMVCEE